MAILRVNADRFGTLLSADPAFACWRKALHAKIAEMPRAAPVVIMVHGYRYCWHRASRRARANPQTSLYRDDGGAAGWPGGLGFASDGNEDGLCIAFGWQARHPGPGSFRHVHRAAKEAGKALVKVIEAVQAALPGHPIDAFAHSLGARVLIQAMVHQPCLAFDRVILMGGAEHTSQARAMLHAQDSVGTETQIYQIAARSNDMFDLLYEVFGPKPEKASDAPLGAYGLGVRHRRWIDVQIDHPETRDWLAKEGVGLHMASLRISHWCFYLDPGAMVLYGAILRKRARWSIAAMRARAVPEKSEARWSRIVPLAPALKALWVVPEQAHAQSPEPV